MSELNNPGNPLFEGPTDPISGMGKIFSPGTDPISGMAKIETPGTDPVSGMAKIFSPGTDPVSGLPPVKPPNPNYVPAVQSTGRGVRNTIIIVCIIIVLLIGGGFVIESAQPGAPSGGATVTLQPGVIQRQHQIQVYISAKEQLTTSGSALCAADSTQGTLEERLVGGGYTSDDDHGITLNAQSSYPGGNNGNWYGNFLPQAQGHYATVIAVCLREPSAFFSGLQSFDTVQSLPKQAAHDDKHPASAVAVAACPMGEAILGGGYESEYSGGGVYSIDASYPAYVNGVGEWNVAFHVDPANGLQRVQLTAYAVCSKGLTTLLEHKAIAGIASGKNPYTQDSMTCARGTLLTGGYQITAPSSLVAVGDDSPLNDMTRTPASGDFVQHWYVEASSSGWQAGVSPGDLWVTCLDASTSTTPEASAAPTVTAPAPLPTSTPRPRPTATPTPRAKPTNTPVPSCQSIVTGSGAMNVDNTYLNVDSSTGIGHNQLVAQAYWNPAAGAISPVNGAALADLGTIGSGGYSGLTCAQLKSASYIARLVPVTNGEVFLVKTPGGHLARVLITLTPGNANPTLTWETYQP